MAEEKIAFSKTCINEEPLSFTSTFQATTHVIVLFSLTACYFIINFALNLE